MSSEGEDLLAPLPTSPAIRSNTAAMRFASSYDDSLAESGGNDDASSVASPHIPGTRRLPKNPSKSINPNATITQHIRHRSSLFWLQTNSITNIAAFEESNWDAESFINKRKELQFALEKLPVFLKNKTNSTLFGRRSPAPQEEGEAVELSFDLLAAKLAQEEIEYEQEIVEILRKRRLQRAFQAWLAHHAWKKRVAANKRPRKKRNNFPRDEDRPISLVVLANHPPTPPPVQEEEECTPPSPVQVVEEQVTAAPSPVQEQVTTAPSPAQEEEVVVAALLPVLENAPSAPTLECTIDSPATTETMDTYMLGEEETTINKRPSQPPPRLSALLGRVFRRPSHGSNKPVAPPPHPNLLTRAVSFLKQHQS